MPIRNQNWYDLQATRRYPLDERSTGQLGTFTAFVPLPPLSWPGVEQLWRDDILVDCHIRFPSTLGNYAFVQGVTITNTLVTLVFGVADGIDDYLHGPGAATSIAAISLPLSEATQSVHHAIKGLVDGVAGWVVFGAGVKTPFAGRYDSPRQTLISPRCARPYTPLPIPTIKKTGSATALQGVVQLTAAAPVTCELEEASIGDQTAQALVFRLVGEVFGVNALKYFLGPCGQRPESNTCEKSAIETINGIRPDCDGNININFAGTGLSYRPFFECGGGDVIGSLGLHNACGAENSIRVPKDKCNPSASEDQSWYNPIEQLPPDVIESETLPSIQTESCSASSFCIDFDGGVQNTFQTIRGLFAFQTMKAPFGCAGEFPSSPTQQEAEANLASRYVYGAANLADTNLTLLKNCASDWVLGTTFETEIKIANEGLAKNGGIVLNYLAPVPALGLAERYILVRLDGSKNKLQIRRINGAADVIEAETDFFVNPSAWYKLVVTPTDVGGSVLISVAVTGLTDPGANATLATTISSTLYGDPTGTAGLQTFRSAAYFTKFEVQV